MAVSTSFYKNVYLLTQMVPPSDDFKKYFREGMFDKPNTAGFVHVSHYLLSVYDIDRFKKSVQWPVICKKTESRFRTDIKEYLTMVAHENSDIGFPPILASYLLHASGTKFCIVMWKLSQVVLRTYISRETKQPVLSAPKVGLAEETTKKVLRNSTNNTRFKIMNHQESFKKTAEATKAAADQKMETLSKLKAEYVEKKRALVHLASEAPVVPEVKKCLTDIENTEIIKMWQDSIEKNVNYVQKRYGILRDIESLSNKVSDMVNNKINNTTILDGKQLIKVNTSALAEMPFPPDIQVLLIHLYKDEKLDFYNFIQLFELLLGEVHRQLRKAEIPDVSQCLLQVEAGREDMKLALDVLQTLLESTKSSLDKVQTTVSQQKLREMLNESCVPNVDDVLFLPSPPIKINTNVNTEKDELERRVDVTPVQGLYKSLFRRHERQTDENSLHIPQYKPNLLISRINLDDTLALTSNDKMSSRSILPLKINRSNTEQIGKYSRLFSASLKKNSMKANYSVLSTPSATRANSTAIGEISSASELNLDVTARSLFTLRQNVSTPKPPVSLQMDENFSEKFTTDKNEVEAMLDKVCKPVMDERTEVEFTAENNKNSTKRKEKSRRISISDLVERYKNLRDTTNVTRLECNDE